MITGAAAAYILNLPLLDGLLLGAIVGSTDAAAVFSLLRNADIHINKRLKSTLEIESASNDPMAIFLTIGLLEVLVNDMPLGVGLLKLFVMQIGVGGVVGLLVGWASVQIINRIQLVTSGLYPVLVAACGLFAFGVAANLGGSGFLAIFVAGVMIGNRRIAFQRSTFLFHDGLAWMSQIVMFVVLGLLINPMSLLDVWLEGLMIAAILILVARPLAVTPILKMFGFTNRETGLVAWVGLRGSVPIILAIFPLIFGLEGAELIFNVVFFVVLISATLQGTTLPYVARKLGLTVAPPIVPAASLEITALEDVDADIVEYRLGDTARAVNRRLSQIALPDGTVVAMITRGKDVIPPRGSTLLQAGDHLFVVLRPDIRPFVNYVFAEGASITSGEFPDQTLRLKGSTSVGEVLHSYGLTLDDDMTCTLDKLLHERLPDSPSEGDELVLGDVTLSVLGVLEGRITTIGVTNIQPALVPTNMPG